VSCCVSTGCVRSARASHTCTNTTSFTSTYGSVPLKLYLFPHVVGIHLHRMTFFPTCHSCLFFFCSLPLPLLFLLLLLFLVLFGSKSWVICRLISQPFLCLLSRSSPVVFYTEIANIVTEPFCSFFLDIYI